jgi:hypothetical protein
VICDHRAATSSIPPGPAPGPGMPTSGLHRLPLPRVRSGQVCYSTEVKGHGSPKAASATSEVTSLESSCA